MDTAGGDDDGAPPPVVVKQEEPTVVDLTEDDEGEDKGGVTVPPSTTTLPSEMEGDLALQELLKQCAANPSGNLDAISLRNVSLRLSIEESVLTNSWIKFRMSCHPSTLDSASGRLLQPDGVLSSPISNGPKRKSEATASSPAAQKPRIASTFHAITPPASTPQSGPPVQLKIEDGDKKPKGLPVPKRVSLPAPDSVSSAAPSVVQPIAPGGDDNGYVDLSMEQSDDDEFVAPSSSVSAPTAGATNLPNCTGQTRDSLGVVESMQPTSNSLQANPSDAKLHDPMTLATPTQTQCERRLLKQVATSLTDPAFHSSTSTSTFVNSATQPEGQQVTVLEKNASVASPLPRSAGRLSPQSLASSSKSRDRVTVALARNGIFPDSALTKESRSIVCNAILDRCMPNGTLEKGALPEIARHYQLGKDTPYRMWRRILASVVATGAVDPAFVAPEPWTNGGDINEAYAALSKVLAQRNYAATASVHSNAGVDSIPPPVAFGSTEESACITQSIIKSVGFVTILIAGKHTSRRLAYCHVPADTVVTHERMSAPDTHALNGQPDQKDWLLPLDDTVEALSRKFITVHKCDEEAFRADQDVRCMVDHLHYLLQPGESVLLRRAQDDTESAGEVLARLCLCANYTLDNEHCQVFMVRAERGMTSLKLHAKEQCSKCAMQSGVSV